MKAYIMGCIIGLIIMIIMNMISKKGKNTQKNVMNTINIQDEKTGINDQNNIEIQKDNSPLVQIDSMYLNNEKVLLNNIIKNEIQSKGEDERTLTTAKINKKRTFLILLFGVLTFIYALMYFFNISLTTCLLCEIITLLIYKRIAKSFNIVNVISKQARENPNEDISNMVANVISNKKSVIVPNIVKIGITMSIAILIPVIAFINPKILYSKYGDGYAVVKYTRGLTPQNTEVVIPDTHNGKNVISIGTSAFKNTNVKKVKLPQNLESIQANAFYGCKSLTSIIIPQNVTEIRASAFENCTNLRTVSLPNGLVDIRARAFKNNTKLYQIELPDSLEYLGAAAFSHCSSLIKITIPDKVTEINGQTFEYCTSLKSINLHDNIISIHGEVFVEDKNLDNVILPSKITEIRGNTFEGCISLSSIIIPEGVTRIGGHAFYGCRRLSYVFVPSTVVEIGSSAFRQCTSLYTIKVPPKALINERAFKESPTKVTKYSGKEKPEPYNNEIENTNTIKTKAPKNITNTNSANNTTYQVKVTNTN